MKKDAFSTSGNSPTKQKKSRQVTPDFVVDGGGSIFLLRPLTDSAREWVESNIGQDNGFQPYWPTVVIEHRYISDIVAGIQGDGLRVA